MTRTYTAKVVSDARARATPTWDHMPSSGVSYTQLQGTPRRPHGARCTQHGYTPHSRQCTEMIPQAPALGTVIQGLLGKF